MLSLDHLSGSKAFCQLSLAFIIHVFENQNRMPSLPLPSSSLPYLSLPPNLDQRSPSTKNGVHLWDRDRSGVHSFLPRFLPVGFAKVVVIVWTALLDVIKAQTKKRRSKGGRYLWIQAHVFITGAALQACRFGVSTCLQGSLFPKDSNRSNILQAHNQQAQ
jgi:hypothetical protein